MINQLQANQYHDIDGSISGSRRNRPQLGRPINDYWIGSLVRPD